MPGIDASDADMDDASELGIEDAIQMDEDAKHILVTPGQVVTSNPQAMRGHGTDIKQGRVYATLAGRVERINKLVSVKALHSRYTPEIGDLVIGRITEVGKRWKVDIGARQDAVLLLASIHLPGGILRRKSAADKLQMRQFFQEGDLLAAEVQAQFADGAASLHTRSTRYGKLRNGQLTVVPSEGMVRSAKSHVCTFGGVDAVMGVNGYIWVCKHSAKETATGVRVEEASEGMYTDANDEVDLETRRSIAHVARCIQRVSAEGRVSEAAIRQAL